MGISFEKQQLLDTKIKPLERCINKIKKQISSTDLTGVRAGLAFARELIQSEINQIRKGYY